MIKRTNTLISIAILLGLISCSAFGQKPTFEKVKDVLTKAGFTEADFETLEKGKIVIKELEVESEGEVAFSGAIMLKADRDTVFAAFRRAIEKQRKEVSEQRGLFRQPATIKDLTKLTIDKKEINSLADCKDKDCSWSLSTALIEKVNAIDWTSSGAEKKADELIRQIMVDHTNEYLKNGDDSLMTYNDDPEPLSLQEEYKSLLENLLWIEDFAPEFKEYVREFPEKKLENIEDLATWEKVDVALKSVIINSHTILYKKEDEGIQQGLSISKQIYANHYFHSSLSLTGIISFPQDDGSFKTYVFFESHSRAGALTGTMGKLAGSAVKGEAENKLSEVLKDTRKYTAYELGNEDDVVDDRTLGILGRVLTNPYILGFIGLIILFVVFIIFTRKKSKKS